jgi:endonuclease/exonuclease/phosphatase (EEP) superfamily protein YafD
MAPSRNKSMLIPIGLYAAALAALGAMNRIGADRWWFGAVNLYLPQALWAVPGVLLLAACLLRGRRRAWLPALLLAAVLGPIMGFRWSMRTPPGPGGRGVRVMTCNAKYGDRDTGELFKDIVKYQPAVVLLQDADGLMEGPSAAFFKGWNVRSFDQFVIASRLPLSVAEVCWSTTAMGRRPMLRCRVDLGGRAVTLYDVHFLSPRDGLNAFRTSQDGRWHFRAAIQDIEESAAVRFEEARALRSLVEREAGPVIIAGDLNSPDPSQVCASLRGAGLQDAFDAAGRGYGYTYGHYLLQHRLPWFRLSWMRIDHIMTGAGVRAWRCWVGTRKASDHRPVIADLFLALP